MLFPSNGNNNDNLTRSKRVHKPMRNSLFYLLNETCNCIGEKVTSAKDREQVNSCQFQFTSFKD